jgi:hypothetical protein
MIYFDSGLGFLRKKIKLSVSDPTISNVNKREEISDRSERH